MLSGRSSGALLVGFMPALVLGPVIGGGVPGSPPSAVSESSWQLALNQHYGQLTNASGYSAIVVTGRDGAWVFGGTNPGGQSAPVADRWNGVRLRPSSLPSGLTGFLSDASAPTAGDIWAVSDYGGYVLHWDGKVWRVARRWSRGQITGVTAVSPDDVWIFGTTATGYRGVGTWHFDGRDWTRASGRARHIYQASAASRRDIWAIVPDQRGDHIEHYDGSRWRRARTGRVLDDVRLTAILAVSRHDVWVLGNTRSRSGPGLLVLAHWDGFAWRRLTTTLHAWAGQLARGVHDGALATATAAGPTAAGMVLDVSARGRLTSAVIRAGLGSGISDVALVGGSVWATGGVLTQLGGNAAIWAGPLVRAEPTGY